VLAQSSSITDPYLNAFRGLIPPLGACDLSAIIAFNHTLQPGPGFGSLACSAFAASGGLGF